MALETYRYLRGGMAVMIALLGTAVLVIAALCALGAMLIVNKSGNDTEHVLLNLAGILAFVVAVVPALAAAAPHQFLDGFNHAVIDVEPALVAEFAVYWMVQAVELWGTTARVGAVTRREILPMRAL